MKLNQQRFKLADYERNIFVITPEVGTTIEHVQEPEYLSHVAKQLKPWDRVEVRAEDESWCAEFLVRTCGQGWVKLHLLSHHELAKVQPKEPAPVGFEVKWAGPHAKFRVTRKSDKEVLKDSFASEAEASAWLKQYLTTIAA